MKFSVNEIVIVLFHNVLIEALVVSRFVEDTPYGPKAFYEVELKDPSLSDGQTVTLEDCSVFRHPVVGDALSTEGKIKSLETTCEAISKALENPEGYSEAQLHSMEMKLHNLYSSIRIFEYKLEFLKKDSENKYRSLLSSFTGSHAASLINPHNN